MSWWRKRKAPRGRNSAENKRSKRRQIFAEQLEDRRMLSANLTMKLTASSLLGYKTAGVLSIQYSNTGTSEMPAPVITLSATENGQPGALLTLNAADANAAIVATASRLATATRFRFWPAGRPQANFKPANRKPFQSTTPDGLPRVGAFRPVRQSFR